MIFMKRLWITCLSLIIFALSASAQNDFCGIKNTSFSEGERLNFKVYYNMSFIWVSAGDATFNIYGEMFNGHKTYHIVGDGKTVKSYEWFYKVTDRYESYLDENTLLPHKFIRNVNEGGTKINNDVVFNHAAGTAKSTTGVFKIPSCTQDVLSAIYYARNIDYSKYRPGDKIPFSMFLDDKVYSLYIKYMGKEDITTKYGTFHAIKIVPLLIEGTIFKGGEKMIVYVSDDANHLPLRVESPILVGSIKVDLMGYDKLRNPFSSAISFK
jgi:hypothetical protein